MTDLGVSPSGSGWSGKPQAGSRLGHTATIPNAMVRLSAEINYLPDTEVFGYFGATAADLRALLALAHGQFDWQPLSTAPTDGSTFLVFTEESGTYDFAEFSLKHGEFCKHGCGWDYATHWAAIAMEAREGGNEVPSRSDDSAGL